MNYLAIFTQRVRYFFVTSTVYMMKFALSDELLKNVSVADVAMRQTSEFSQLQYFLDSYPVLVEVSGVDLDGIQEDFILHQVDEEVRTQERAGP